MHVSLFEKLGHQEKYLKRTNMSLRVFSREPAEARGIVSKELTVGSKTVSIAFFVVDVRGRYNVLLGWDWIHINGCVPSTLHQCIFQWVGEKVEIVHADESAHVAMAEAYVDINGGSMQCLTGRDLTDYNYVSIGKDSFVPISVRPTVNITRLSNSEL
jgi:hypothetical protein